MAELFDRRAFLKRVGLTSLVLATPYVLTACGAPGDSDFAPGEDDALAEQFRTLEPTATAPRVFSLWSPRAIRHQAG